MVRSFTGLSVACTRLRRVTGWSQVRASDRCSVSLETWRTWETTVDKPVRTHAEFVVRLRQLLQKHTPENVPVVNMV